MASVKIHTDLCNFKRTRKGFTDRQIKGAVVSIAFAIAVTALLAFVCGLPFPAAGVPGAVLAMPLILGYCTPLADDVFEMHAEDMVTKARRFGQRGNTVAWRGEEMEPMHGEVSREYVKKTKGKGAEVTAGA